MASRGMNLHFLDDWSSWACFHVLIRCLYIFVEMSIWILCPFLIGLFVFLLLSCNSSLCILDISPLSDTRDYKVPLQIFYPILWVFFKFFDGIFSDTKVFNFDEVLCCASSLSHVLLFVTLWTVALQAPLSMGIVQARILESVAMPSSRGSSQPRDWTQSTALQADPLPSEPPSVFSFLFWWHIKTHC